MKFAPFVAIAAAVVAAGLLGGATYQYAGNIPLGIITSAEANVPDLASPHLKVIAGAGHGSGTHLGNGFILTASHVVDGGDKITVKSDAGTSYPAEVLWVNKGYDVALLYVGTPMTVGALDLDCAPHKAGERVTLYGNPMDLEFVYTHGWINGDQKQRGPWRETLPLDMTIVMGQSGGAVVGENGKVIGIGVGVMVAFQGLTGIGYMVPATSVCHLLGKA